MNENPLGDDDATIQVTYVPKAELGSFVGEEIPPEDPPTALLTVRAKDQDLTEAQLRALAASCLRIADAMKADNEPPPVPRAPQKPRTMAPWVTRQNAIDRKKKRY